MAISFVNATTSSTNVVSVPVSVTDDDLMIMVVNASSASALTYSCTGWTIWVSGSNRAVLYRYASSEPSSYTVTVSAGYTDISLSVAAFRAARIGESGAVSAAGTNPTASGTTVSFDGSVLIGLLTSNATAFTTAPSFGGTGWGTAASDLSGVSQFIAYKSIDAGATGDITTNSASSTSARAQLLSISPTISGAASITEAGDSVAATSGLPIKANAAIDEVGDSLTAASTLETGIRAGTATITEAADTVIAAGAVNLAAFTSTTEGADTLSVNARIAIAGAVSINEAADTLFSAASRRVAGAVSITEGGDILSARASVTYIFAVTAQPSPAAFNTVRGDAPPAWVVGV